MRLIGLIAGDTKKENENMSRLTEQGRKDSISVRALTLVATFYLPGTFLAVSSLTIDSTTKIKELK